MTVQDIKNRLSKHNAGYWCPEEWEPFIVELDEKLAKIDPDYKVDQVKEKFGGLRYYISSKIPFNSIDGQRMYMLISEAEHKVWEYEDERLYGFGEDNNA